jgi:hypothetical protein
VESWRCAQEQVPVHLTCRRYISDPNQPGNYFVSDRLQGLYRGGEDEKDRYLYLLIFDYVAPVMNAPTWWNDRVFVFVLRGRATAHLSESSAACSLGHGGILYACRITVIFRHPPARRGEMLHVSSHAPGFVQYGVSLMDSDELAGLSLRASSHILFADCVTVGFQR